MGKLKEKLLNNLSEQEMDEQFELSAFEYVEYMSKYKEQQEEYIPTDEELEKLESMIEEYYKSKEFREYVENYTPTDEYVDSLTDEEIDEAFAEHNAAEDGIYLSPNGNYVTFKSQKDIDELNDSMTLKYTDDDVVAAIKALNNEKWLIDGVMNILNDTWNRKNGVF